MLAVKKRIIAENKTNVYKSMTKISNLFDYLVSVPFKDPEMIKFL